MNLASIAIRASSGLHPEVETFISPSYANITDSVIISALNNLVTSVKNNGLWTPQKAIYPLVGGNATSHSYNLKDPSLYQITWSGGITHDANGVTGNGTTGYGNTGIVPSSVLSLNNTHISTYSRTSGGASSRSDMGVQSSSDSLLRISTGSSGDAYLSVHDNSSGVSYSQNAPAFFLVSRRGQSTGALYRNSTKFSNFFSSVAGTLSTHNLTLMAHNNAGTIQSYSSKNYAFWSVGDGLTDTQCANLYTAVQAFQTALSRQV